MGLTLEQAIERLPTDPELVYVDYRDIIEDANSQQQIVRGGFLDECSNTDWILESQREGCNYIIKEEFTKEELEQLGDDVDKLREHLLDNDKSDPIKDVIKNTRDTLVLYDVNFEFSEPYNKEEAIKECKEACRYLGIHTKYRRQFYNILIDAHYGGYLMLMIDADLSAFYEHNTKVDLDNYGKNHGFISFNNRVNVCIIHTGNGSGRHEHIKLQDKSNIVVPFIPDKLFVDNCFTYGLQTIFGSRIEGSGVDLHYEQPKGKLLNTGTDISPLTVEQQQEAKYKRTYAAGKCTFGDTNMNRHRNIVYQNDFPAGRRCKDCGQFWID